MHGTCSGLPTISTGGMGLFCHPRCSEVKLLSEYDGLGALLSAVLALGEAGGGVPPGRLLRSSLAPREVVVAGLE